MSGLKIYSVSLNGYEIKLRWVERVVDIEVIGEEGAWFFCESDLPPQCSVVRALQIAKQFLKEAREAA